MRTTVAVFSLAIAQAALLGQLQVMPEGMETRWASPENPKGLKGEAGRENAGRKGRPSVPVRAGERLVLAEVNGSSGMVRRIWATIDNRSARMLRGLRIEMYWDGAATPAVSAPFGDFFGTGLGEMAAYQSALFASPEGRSFLCFIPMPFRKGMKIVLTNESGLDLGSLYYDVDYTIGDRHGPETLYFHAYFRRENPTTMQKDYEILPHVSGKGRYLGANLGVIANRQLYANTWWGEGEVKVYMDGDTTTPTLSGTGTEDYIGTGWGQGAYTNLYQGCQVADAKRMRYCFYRYHVPDPVYFQREARVTIQQIGYRGAGELGELHKTGKPFYRAGAERKVMDPFDEGLFERQDDWSSCVYFYLDRPENGLPKLMAAEDRIKGL